CAAELQVRQAEGRHAQGEGQIPVLEAGLDAAMNALDVLRGVQPGTYRGELSLAASIPIAPGVAETGTPAEMIRRRPDLIMAERRLAATNARIGVAISEYYPKFSLGALLGSATAISSGNLFTTGANQAQGVLGLRWRLFDFGRVDAQIAAARGREAEALAAYRGYTCRHLILPGSGWRVGCAKCKQQQLWRPSVISYGVNEMTTTDNSIVGDSRVARLGGNSNFPEVPMLQRHPAVVVAVIGLLPFFLAACSDATSSNDPRMQAPLVRIATVEASPQSE